MRSMLSVMAIGSAILVTGCAGIGTLPDPIMARAPTAYHDVAYYDTNPIERSATIAWCGDNPGLAAKVPSCDSASTSKIHAWHKTMGFE